MQVDSYSNDRPCPVMCKSDIGGQDCFTLDGRNHNAVNNDKDIISTEPLAPEGTKEWALQMMKLGKCVCHVKAPSIKYHRPTHYVKRVVRENCTDDMSDAVWMKGADSTGWQLCEPKPESQYKVGDWVEHKESKEQATIKRIMSYGAIEIEFAYSTESDIYQADDFHNDFRKLSPSEVIVRIGCLSGTVRPVSTNGTHIWFHLIGVDDKTIAIIRINCLDAPTRKLVKSLLKTQDEEK